jgi:hypothetical protein
MAQDVISTLFGVTPRNTAFDKYAQDQMIDFNKAGASYADLGRANIERANALVQNAGTDIGVNIGRLLGGQTPQMAEEQRVQGMLGGASLQDPEQLMAASDRFAQAGDLPRAKALQDAALDIEKKRADINRLNALASGTGRGGGGSGGTGPERMATFVANVQARLQAGEDVPQEEILRAQNFSDVLAKNQFFKMDDGSIVSVPKNDFGRIAELMREGAVEVKTPAATAAPAVAPAAAPAMVGAAAPSAATPAVRPTGGATVIQTPSSVAAAAKTAEGKRQEQVVFESDISQIDKALDIVNSKGRWAAGAGSLLSFIPESSASELADTIQSIDAAKLIQQIQALKSTSPSGSTGFGSLTEKEGLQLINRLGSIKQTKSPEKLKEALIEVRKLLGKLAGKELPSLGEEKATGKSANDALIDRVMAAPQNAGKTRQQIEAGLRKRGLIK